ncbi:MAG: phosphohistidine phosphatase [Deltaproteobacteria bacterium SG8_13]|nr:MAG: phosphohistidine phosphatase [Deltaproteobacteria bacterium SG8_13]
MSLYLVQHGKSLAKNVDPEKGLSEEGQSEVEMIAAVARGYGVTVSAVFHSGKKRARQTADIFSTALDVKGGSLQRSGLNPLDDVTEIAHSLSADENQMLVGHLPFMERLTSYLITGSIDKPVFKFQNGGIVCLDQDLENRLWFIKWALMPNID